MRPFLSPWIFEQSKLHPVAVNVSKTWPALFNISIVSFAHFVHSILNHERSLIVVGSGDGTVIFTVVNVGAHVSLSSIFFRTPAKRIIDSRLAAMAFQYFAITDVGPLRRRFC